MTQQKQVLMTRRVQWTILIIALVLFFLLTAITVETRRPWIDESWAGTPAWSFVARGYTGTPAFDATEFGLHGMKGLDRICYWEPPLYEAVQIIWYSLVPFNLITMRYLSVFAGLVGLFSFYVVMKRLSGDTAAATLLVLLMSCDYIVDSAASFGRADAMSFAFQAAAYATFLSFREKRLDLAILLSQTCVVASGLTHPNGGVLAFFGQLFLTLYLDRSRIGWKQIGLAACPYLVGAIAWGSFILKDPQTFLSQYSFQTALRFTDAAHPWNAIRREFVARYIKAMGLGAHSVGSMGPIALKALIFIAYAVGLAGVLLTPALRKSTAGKVFLGLLFVVYLPYYTFLEATKATYYFIYIIYIYTSLLVLWLCWCWRERKLPRILIVLAVLGLVTIQSGGLIQRGRINQYKTGYTSAVNFLRSHTTPDDLIMGSQELGFALGFEGNFLDDYRLGLSSGKHPDYIVIEDIYEDRFDMLHQQRPQDYAKLQELLKQYSVVYSQGDYRILKRIRTT